MPSLNRAWGGGLLALALVVAAAPGQARSRNPLALAEADSLASRVEVLARQGRSMDPDLIEAARRVVAIRERELGPTSPRSVDALQRLAGVHMRRTEPLMADSLMRLVVAARRIAKPPDVHALATSMYWLAEAQRGMKRLASAVSTADSALAFLHESAIPDTGLEIRIHISLGDALAEQGKSERSRVELERAVALAEPSASADPYLLSVALRNLGRALALVDEHELSRACFERAIAIQEKALGPDSPDLASTLYMASSTASALGDNVTERRFAERALAIRERVFGSDHPTVAAALSVVGHATATLGDLEASHALYERAVRIYRAAPSAPPADLAIALNNLGTSWLRLGDGRRALESLSEARDIRARIFGPGRGAGFWSRCRLADALSLSGDAAGAVAAIDSLLASPVRRTPIDVADAFKTRGTAQRRLGNLAGAEADFSRAFALEDSAFGIGSTDALSSLALRAALRYRLGRRGEAFSDAMRAEQVSRQAIREVARGLSEHEALGFERVRASGLEVLMALVSDSVGTADSTRARVLDAVAQSRLVVLDELADERRARPRGDRELEALHLRLEAARDAYAAAMVATLRQGRAPDSVAVAAREARERAERALAERSGSFRNALRQLSPDLGAIGAALPPRAALVSYIRHGDPADLDESDLPIAARGSRRSRYSAFVWRGGAHAPAIVPLGTSADVEARIGRWITACATPPPAGRDAARAAERRCAALGQSVRAAVWTPLERFLAGASSVFVVPDGALHAINFLALPDGSGAYLADRGPLVHRLTAERDLLAPIDADMSSRGLLAFGGADFEHVRDEAPLLAVAEVAAVNRRAAVADTLRVRFGPLPATTAEVDEIAGLWRASARQGDENDVLERTGAEASEGAFKQLAPGRRVLHLATHGFALGSAGGGTVPAGTRAVGAVTEKGPRAAPRRLAALLPGLALAGANRDPSPEGEDGFLTAEEITALDLSGVEWAVLSACESGLSDPEAVEAVQGLHRAFRRAGARTVIMSLWLVDDAATRTWMHGLYETRLVRGASTATAVRDASRGLLRERRARGEATHPFYWAAFVAAGDWH